MTLKLREIGDRMLSPDEGKALLDRAEGAEARVTELEGMIRDILHARPGWGKRARAMLKKERPAT